MGKNKLATASATALAIMIPFMLVGCDACGNEIQQELNQPGGPYRALLFEHDCGAATSFSEQIALLNGSEVLGGRPGNVFVMDDDHGRSTLRVEMKWLDDRTLQIAYPGKARVFLRVPHFKDISIVYTTFEAQTDERHAQ